MHQDLFQYMLNPFCQAFCFLLLTSLALFVLHPRRHDRAWVYAGVIFILFILSNSVLLLYNEHEWRYLFFSLLTSVTYLMLIPLVINGYVNIFRCSGSGESSMIFLFIIYHPFLLLASIFIKWVFNI